MCGIIGILGNEPVADSLLSGLSRLEYRGYDSAGVATVVNGSIDRRRAEGKLAQLSSLLENRPITGTVGIGHTRWATHGRPSEANAHPHGNDRVAVVHNGIIENFHEIRRRLEAEGRVFETETDTEVIVHLLTEHLVQGGTPQEAVSRTLSQLEGAFALAMIFGGHHDLMIGARRGSPLAVGYGEGAMYLGSDALALAPLTDQVSYLEDGDWVELGRESVAIRDADGQLVERPVKQSSLSGSLIGKAGHRHYMQKEIHEQPTVLAETLHAYLQPSHEAIAMPSLPFDAAQLSRLTIAACGTAYYAGLVSRYWFEQLARLPVEIDVASEFRYREALLPRNGASLFISQSGETIDTLAALRYARGEEQPILSVVNVPESAVARESDQILYTLAGPEIGVASTKAFTSQLMVLACLALHCARQRGTIDAAEEARLAKALTEIPGKIAEVLSEERIYEAIAQQIMHAKDVLFLGRGSSFPIAMEGALKLKEISYIHAEGYAAGEMKHGPIALIDENVPVIVCAPSGPLFEKTLSNVQEVIARGAKVVFVSDRKGLDAAGDRIAHGIAMPEVDPFVAPILYALPMQLLAYHTAVLKGTDVDQPRNLAKSVTVE